jgi:hypothetical protein
MLDSFSSLRELAHASLGEGAHDRETGLPVQVSPKLKDFIRAVGKAHDQRKPTEPHDYGGGLAGNIGDHTHAVDNSLSGHLLRTAQDVAKIGACPQHVLSHGVAFRREGRHPSANQTEVLERDLVCASREATIQTNSH